MLKRVIAMVLVLILTLSLAACGDKTAKATDAFRVGLVTSTVSQNEEEFRAAEEMVKKYGADMIKHVTYPDRFMQEQETTISQIVALASDPLIKAIVVVQAVPGTAAAIDRIKESREDIVFVIGNPHEDPEVASARADIVLDVDQLTRGVSIVKDAKNMGAETFVHFSFPRHMSYELLSQRRDIMKKTAEEEGMKFVEVDSPDPTGDAGVPGTQQFILEDVPRQVQAHGKNTVFFGTNCAMQEPMIRAVMNEKAIYTEQCCPSPYHAYPGALGIEIPQDKSGDVEYMLSQISAKVAEGGNSGRMGSWKVPASMAMVRAGVEYGVAYGKGETEKFNKDKMTQILSEVIGGEVKVQSLEGMPNFLMFVAELEIF